MNGEYRVGGICAQEISQRKWHLSRWVREDKEVCPLCGPRWEGNALHAGSSLSPGGEV